MSYHIYYNNESMGPYALEQMKEMVTSGILTPESLVFIEGASEWQPATSIEGLFENTPTAQAIVAEESEPIVEAVKEVVAETPAPAAKAPAAKKTLNMGLAAKSATSPIKKAVSAVKTVEPVVKKIVGISVNKVAKVDEEGALPAAPANMTPEQKAAYEAAMAKKAAGGGGKSKKKLFIIIGIVVVVILVVVGVLVALKVIPI